jgi:AbrB family looped-hinge helix DNA binding protein
MSTLATTKMSSRGQVVIPEAVRNEMGLKPGDEFVVLTQNDVVMLKGIKRPSMREFDALIRKARRQARAAGLTHADVAKAVASVQGRK